MFLHRESWFARATPTLHRRIEYHSRHGCVNIRSQVPLLVTASLNEAAKRHRWCWLRAGGHLPCLPCAYVSSEARADPSDALRTQCALRCCFCCDCPLALAVNRENCDLRSVPGVARSAATTCHHSGARDAVPIRFVFACESQVAETFAASQQRLGTPCRLVRRASMHGPLRFHHRAACLVSARAALQPVWRLAARLLNSHTAATTPPDRCLRRANTALNRLTEPLKHD